MKTKERPILFSGPMVRAILEGRKTQTRRVINFKRLSSIRRGRLFYSPPFKSWAIANTADYGTHIDEHVVLVNCPYGDRGDRLWVRETWGESGHNRFEYRASPADGTDFRSVSRWRPSIHMPREASRITLEITDVRVQRLQDISDEDAMAEGGYEWNYGFCHSKETGTHETPRGSFRALWASINGADSWAANPWVWAISFSSVPLGDEREQSQP